MSAENQKGICDFLTNINKGFDRDDLSNPDSNSI